MIGAFAITNHSALTILGSGVDATHLRPLTVYLVRQGTLEEHVHLEHSAHYAIGALSLILLVTIQYASCNEIGGVPDARVTVLAKEIHQHQPAPRKYPELREPAVREARITGRPIAHVAKDLGIHKEALLGWVRQAEANRGVTKGSLQPSATS